MPEEKPRNLWNEVDYDKYQSHVTISFIESEDLYETNDNDRAVYMEDLQKRNDAYGTCGECNKPGTGEYWCQHCNAKRFKENFKNWASGNKDIDELIQQSQLNAVYSSKCLEWVPFENFQNVTYITRGGFGKIYSANWPEGFIQYWDIENEKWKRRPNSKVALKSLDNSSDISSDFLNEIKSHLQIYLFDVIKCYGITQNPNSKDYMMVLRYCKSGNLRNYLKQPNKDRYESKIKYLSEIARGLLDIHNAGKVHKDLHSGNILFNYGPLISDLGMCQPANSKDQPVNKGIYGVLPYMAPEILRGYQYTKAADIYSFGVIMNEFLFEETPFNNISHDHILTLKICKGLRPKVSKDTPKLLVDLIARCWDCKVENRPTAKELFQRLKKWSDERYDCRSEIYSQIKEYKQSRLKSNNKYKIIKTHPHAVYTSRLLNFKNLPEPENSNTSILLTSTNSISECLDCQIE